MGPGGWALAAIIPGIIGSIIARRAANRQGEVLRDSAVSSDEDEDREPSVPSK